MTKRIGNVVFIQPEGNRICQLCGAFTECRAAGPNGEQVCVTCANKDPEAKERYFTKMFGPSNRAHRRAMAKKSRKAKRTAKPARTEAVRENCPDCGKPHEGEPEELHTCACGARWHHDLMINGKVRPEYIRAPRPDDADAFKIPESTCPECGYLMDSASTLPGEAVGAQPLPGDFSLCLNCAQVLCFKLDFSLRRATLRECDHLPDEALTVIKALKLRFPHGVPKKDQ